MPTIFAAQIPRALTYTHTQNIDSPACMYGHSYGASASSRRPNLRRKAFAAHRNSDGEERAGEWNRDGQIAILLPAELIREMGGMMMTGGLVYMDGKLVSIENWQNTFTDTQPRSGSWCYYYY